MTDPRPADAPLRDDDPPDLEREAKIDELLLAGLEHYFGGRFQEAINVWGRVLFLDRGHARARAYIERARGALAERQRRAEELVEEGVAAIDRGDGAAARRLLASAVASGDPHDLARAHLDRLDRLSAPVPAARSRRFRSRAAAEAPAGGLEAERPPRPVRTLPILVLALCVMVVIVFAASRDWLGPFVTPGAQTPPGTVSAALAQQPLPVPRPAELALDRARDLYASGYMKAALAALDGVSAADPLAPDANRLRAEIQGALIAPSAERPPAGATGAAVALPEAGPAGAPR